MTFSRKLVFLLFFIILPSSALFAQETDAPTEAETTETPAPATEAPAEEAPAEAEAPSEPEVTVQQFTDWEVRCAAEQQRCLMYYLAKDGNGNSVAEIRIEALPEDNPAAAGVTVTTPLNTLLSNGLVIQIDSRDPLQYPYTWCSRSGCFARFGLRSAELNSFRRGNSAVMLVASIADPDTVIRLNVSLSGFTAAFKALSDARG